MLSVVKSDSRNRADGDPGRKSVYRKFFPGADTSGADTHESGKNPANAERRTGKIYSWWNDLGSDFIRLNQNYQDYMRELNSVKAEQMMKTQESHTAKTKRSRTSGSTGTVKTYRLREDQEQAGLLHGTFERDSAGKRSFRKKKR